MNKGSNPVGVATANVAESEENKRQTGTSAQGDVSPVSQAEPVTLTKKVRGPKVAQRAPEVGDRIEVEDGGGCWLGGRVVTAAKTGRGVGRVLLRVEVPYCSVSIPVRLDDEWKTWRWPVGDPRNDLGVECNCCHDGRPCECCSLHWRAEQTHLEGCDCDAAGCVCPACIERTRKCARFGCCLERVEGSIWCSGHGRAAAAAGDGGCSLTCDNVPAIPEEDEQPNDHDPEAAEKRWAHRLSADAFEFAWQRLAEDSANDPVTVARCKRLYDLRVRELGGAQ